MAEFSVPTDQAMRIATSQTGPLNPSQPTREGIRKSSLSRLTAFLSRQRVRQRIALTIAGAIFLYVCMDRGLSVRELIIAVGALTIAFILFNGERGIQYGFTLWVLTLALGYRTIALTPDLHIHPSEILLWVLLGCIALHRRLVTTSKISFPIWLWLMIPFWVLAWWPLIVGNAAWDQMLNEFRNFFLLVPLMIVATVVLDKRENWRRLLLTLFFASTWIAVMGILEFWFSSIAALFPAFMTTTTAGVVGGFERAMFSFWGGPMATFVCALAVPFGIVAVHWWPGTWQRTLIVGSVAAQFIAIYIGGYRSIWFVMVAEILIACLFCLKRNRLVIAAACLLVIIGGYQLIPQSGNRRAMSGIEALQGHPTDSSARDRIGRAEGALNQMIAAPLGSGWSAAGWVHSDFIQVGANLGLLGGLIFLGGYLYTLFRMFRRVLAEPRGDAGDIGMSLLLAYFSVGGILACQGVEVLPQLVLPVWFVWVVVEIWLRQPAQTSEPVNADLMATSDRMTGSWSALPEARG